MAAGKEEPKPVLFNKLLSGANVSVIEHKPSLWDPFRHKDDCPTPQCLLRIKRDMKVLYDEPPPNIYVVADEEDFTIIHAIIVGSFDTPYEGGFFYFVIKCPGTYPIQPPWVRFMTTSGGQVRFNPNIYKNGKVCLSLLGTWNGPSWSPANTLSSCLISIQSLLNEKPYHNEPGFQREHHSGEVKRYNDIIHHETIRVAVCEMLESSCGLVLPPSLVTIMEKTFLEFYDSYVYVCGKLMGLNKQAMSDPFGEFRGNFQFDSLLERLQALKIKLTAKFKVENPCGENDSSDCSDLEDSRSGDSVNTTVDGGMQKKH